MGGTSVVGDVGLLFSDVHHQRARLTCALHPHSGSVGTLASTC